MSRCVSFCIAFLTSLCVSFSAFTTYFFVFFFVSDVPNFGLEPFVVPTAAINADASAELRRGPPLLLHIPNCTQASPTPHPRFLSTVSCG